MLMNPSACSILCLHGICNNWEYKLSLIPSRILIIRISRFVMQDGTTCKITTPIHVQPSLQMQEFDGDSLQCSHIKYEVLSVTPHAGATPSAGHYITRLFVAGDRRLAHWSTDDARPARLVSRDAQHDNQLSQQCYVLILCSGAALKSTLEGH